MSFALELRFRCNRCANEATTPVQNTSTIERLGPPVGWQLFTVGASGPLHLCPGCAPSLDALITNRKE